MSNFDVQDVIPHRGAMCLLSEIIETSEEKVLAKVNINEHSSFFQASKGVAAHIGIEYMAQAISAWANASSPYEEPQIGLLLSCRKYETKQNYYPLNSELIIEAKPLSIDADISVFECKIFDAQKNQQVSSTTLTVYNDGEAVERLYEK